MRSEKDPSQMNAWERRRYERMQQSGQFSSSSQNPLLPPGLVQEVERMQPQIESTVQQTAMQPQEQPQGGFLSSLLHGATFGMAGEEGSAVGSFVGSILPIMLAAKTGGAALPALAGLGTAAKTLKAGGAAAQAIPTLTRMGVGATRLAGTGGTMGILDHLAHRARGEEADPTDIAKRALSSAAIGAAFPAIGGAWKAFRGVPYGVSKAAAGLDPARQTAQDQLRTGKEMLGQFARESGASGARYDLGGVSEAGKSLTQSILKNSGVTNYRQLPITPIAKGITPKGLYSEALKVEKAAEGVRQGHALDAILKGEGVENYSGLSFRGKRTYSAAKQAIQNYHEAVQYESAGMPGRAFSSSHLATLFTRKASGKEVSKAVESLRGTGFTNSMTDALGASKEAARQLEGIVGPEYFEKAFHTDSLTEKMNKVLRTASENDLLQRSAVVEGTINFNDLSAFKQNMVKYGGSLTSILRTLGKPGRRAAALADDHIRMSTGLSGTLTDHYVKTAFYGLKSEEALRVAKAMDGAISTSSLTAKEQKAFNQLRAMTDSIFNRASKDGVQALDKSGNPAGAIEKVKNFFPRYPDKAKISAFRDDVYTKLGMNEKTPLNVALRTIANDPRYGPDSTAYRAVKSYQQMLQRGAATGRLPREEEVLGRLVQRASKSSETMLSGPRVNALFHREEVGIPAELLKDPKEAMLLYINDMSGVISAQNAFGDTGHPMGKLVPLFQQMEGNYPAHIVNYMEEGLQYLVGNKTAKVPEFAGGLMSLNTIRLMSLAVISNMTQTTNTAALAGVKNTAKSLSKIFTNRDEMQQVARLAGALSNPREVQQMYQKLMYEGMMPDSFLGRTVRRGANAVMNLSGFNTIESFNQQVAAYTGYSAWGPDLAKQLASGQNAARITRLFKQMGIDPQKVAVSGILEEHDKLKVASWLLKQTQFPKTMAEIPLWTNHWAGKMIFQFSRFIYKQSQFLKNHVWDEAQLYMKTGGKDGAIAPIMTYMSLGGAAGYGVGTVRDFLSGREKPDDQTLFGSYLDALGWVGGFGLWGNVARVLQGSPAEGFVGLLGPTAGLGLEGIRTLQGGTQVASGLADFMTSDEPEPGMEQMASGVRSSAKGLMGATMPTALSRPISRGEIPGGVEVPLLQQVFSPESYDPTGAKEASREYTSFVERIDDALLEYMTTGSQQPIVELMERAEEEEFQIGQGELQSRMNSPGFQRRLIQMLLRRTTDPQERAQLQQMLQAMDTDRELQTLRSVPPPARGRVDITSLLR